LIVIVIAVMLFAGQAHGMPGLGLPMMATPILAILFDVRSAIRLTLLPTVVDLRIENGDGCRAYTAFFR